MNLKNFIYAILACVLMVSCWTLTCLWTKSVMVETYGSASMVADSLGYDYRLLSDNLYN